MKKKKKSGKIRSLLARIGALTAVLIIVLSCFALPASADGLSYTDEVDVDPWLNGAYLVIGSNVAGRLFTVSLNAVNPNPAASDWSTLLWTDYWHLTDISSGAQSTIGFYHNYLNPGSKSRHRYWFSNSVVANTFVHGFTITLPDIYLRQDDFASFMKNWASGEILYALPYVQFNNDGGSVFDITYEYYYEAWTYGESNTYRYSHDVYCSYSLSRSGVGQKQVPLVPTQSLEEITNSGYIVNNIEYWQDDIDEPTGDTAYTEYLHIKGLSITVEPSPSATLTDFSFNSQWGGNTYVNSICGTSSDYAACLPPVTIPPIDVDFADWLVSAIGGFLDFELYPGLKIGVIVMVPIAIALVSVALKFFAGG